MNREQIEQMLLDRGVTEATLDQHPLLAEALRADPTLMECLQEYDALRAAMGPASQAPVEPPAKGWAAMEQRMTQTIASGLTTRPPHQFRIGRILAWAAAVVVAASGWAVFLLQHSGGPTTDIQGKLAMSAHDIAQAVAVFSNVTDTLDGKASWVAVSKNNADVGLGAAKPAGSRHLLLLRLTLLVDGRTASQADVVIVAGQSATVTLPLNNGRQVRYEIGTTRTPSTGATQLSLWAQLQKHNAPDGESLAALATQLQPHVGQVVSAGEMVTHNDRYELRVSFGQSQAPRTDGQAGRS